MAKDIRKFAATSNMVRVFIADSSSSTGAGLTGAAYNSSGLVIDLIPDNASSGYHYKSAATATIEDVTTVGTYQAPSASNCRFKEVDATNFPGLYEIHFLNGVFDDSGCKALIGRVAGVTNMAPTFFEIQLVAVDLQDSVRAGLTALPNAAAEAAGGLYTRGTGAGQINQAANGQVDTNVVAAGGETVSAIDGGVDIDVLLTLDGSTYYFEGTVRDSQGTIAGASLSSVTISLLKGSTNLQWGGAATVSPTVNSDGSITHNSATITTAPTDNRPFRVRLNFTCASVSYSIERECFKPT